MEKLFLFRYVCLLPAVCSLLGSVLMFLIGAAKTASAFSVFFASTGGPDPSGATRSYEAAVLLVRSVDAFLIGFFLIVFAYSIYVLFLNGVTTDQESRPFPWLKMNGLDQLESALSQLVVIILFVLFLDHVITSEKATPRLGDLVLPVAILCLAAANRLLRRE